MNTGKRIIFAGNRIGVLEEILALNLNLVQTLSIKKSYLERELESRNLPYTSIESKAQLLQLLNSEDYDCFISNGLPYKLPITELKAGSDKQFINIHPSYLPDLRGADPVPGAILFRRDSGATCHVMNDELDKGDIIAQVRIPFDPFWDALGLYQISFVAEREAFKAAAKRDFRPELVQADSTGLIYYTFKESDLNIDLDEPPQNTISRVKAFCNRSKGARFQYKNKLFKVYDAELLRANISGQIFELTSVSHRQVFSVIEDQMVIRLGNSLVKFKKIEGDLNEIKSGDFL